MEQGNSQHTKERKACGGIRIRDAVYGEIFIPQKFLPIVDSYAFQRLRRVKQLATAQYVFPGADHSRFAHSLGTFHVMQQIIAHFEKYFQELGLSECIEKSEKDLILVASLLHDLGHTPFSHALEDVMPNAQKVPHERWTTDIIKDGDENTGLRGVIDAQFGAGSAEKIANLILCQDEEQSPFFKTLNWTNIFHSLISSQLDADRLDYIRRDSLFTGFSYGLIDIDTLISGLRIGILEDGTAVVCIAEKNLADVEGYLYARYQMYRNVYLKPFKMLTEEILRKIVRCVYEAFDQDKLKIADLPIGFKAALQQPEMKIRDFLSLDDYVVMGAIKGWAELKDERMPVLPALCQCLICRNGFIQYEFSDISPKAIAFFKEELLSVLKPHMSEAAKAAHNGKTTDDWMDSFPFLVLKVEYPQLYKASKDNIYIMENSGRLMEISDCSNLVRAFLPRAGVEEGDPKSAVAAIYFNSALLELYLKDEAIFKKLSEDKLKTVIEEVEGVFRSRLASNSIEIEKKYHVPENLEIKEVIQNMLRFFEENGYIVEPCRQAGDSSQASAVRQTDYYLDTSDSKLLQNHCSLRIRIKEGKKVITCKRPVDGSQSCGEQGQMERYEYASEMKQTDGLPDIEIYRCTDSVSFIKKYLSDILQPSELENTIIVENKRTKFLIRRPVETDQSRMEEIYELVFDDVEYNNCTTHIHYPEHQIEIELKSDPATRLNMQLLTTNLEKEFAEWHLETMTESKYERAKMFTKRHG